MTFFSKYSKFLIGLMIGLGMCMSSVHASITDYPLTVLSGVVSLGSFFGETYFAHKEYKKELDKKEQDDPEKNKRMSLAQFAFSSELKKRLRGNRGKRLLLINSACGLIALFELVSKKAQKKSESDKKDTKLPSQSDQSGDHRFDSTGFNFQSTQPEEIVDTQAPAPQVSQPSRAQAAVLGAAIGDALGRVTEFKAHNKQGVTTLSQACWNGVAPYTDDTVMARIVLEETIEGRRNNETVIQIADRLARKFAELFGPQSRTIDPWFDIRAHGPTNINSGQALLALIAGKKATPGTHWWRSRIDSSRRDLIVREGGCGSVMRAWPIGLVFPNDLDRVIELADEQSYITHAHPMARAASVAMAVGVACAYQGMSVDQIVQQMIAAAERFDVEELTYKTRAQKRAPLEDLTAAMLSNDQLLTSDMIRYAVQQAKAGVSPDVFLGTNNDKQGPAQAYRSPHGFVLGWAADESVAAAVYLFVRHANDIKKAIIEGVNTPGDSDSIATLAGALVGAYSGQAFYAEDCAELELLENHEQLVAWARKI